MQPPQSVEEIKAGLETTEKGGVRQSIRHCLTVFQRDPLLSGAIAYNILTDRKDIIKPVSYTQLHFVSLLSVIRRWGGILPPHFGQKKAGDLFQISCSVCRYVGGGYLIVKVRGKLTRCEADKLEFILANHLPL